MACDVRTDLREDGDEIVLTKVIDDTPFKLHCADMRRELGKGFVRDKRGGVAGRHLLSVPMEEAAMLAALKDSDWVEWWNTDSDSALRRLIIRFPHWVCCEGGGIV